jgi:hypothetical protein
MPTPGIDCHHTHTHTHTHTYADIRDTSEFLAPLSPEN